MKRILRARLAARLAASALGLSVLASAPAVLAGNPEAESAFQAGLDAMQKGDLKTACPLLEASQKAEARSGTLLLLASCHEQQGLTATAWTEYKDAFKLADTENRKDNAQKGRDLAAALTPKLSRLRLDPPAPEAGVSIAVTLDGRPVFTFGTHFAVDPGEHVLAASAPGRVAWTKNVTIGKEGDQQTVAIPALAVDAAAKPTPVPTGGAVVAPTPAPGAGPGAGPDTASSGGGIGVWPWVVGVTGLAMTTVAVIARVSQGKAASTIEENCGADRQSCPPEFDFDGEYKSEKTSFAVFLGLGIPGVLALTAGIAGIVVGATSSGDEPAESTALAPVLSFGPDGGIVGLGGRF
ncbi:MAG: hypothetical protein HY908_17475 [Myxococcales bacterium]|nr:hypothetical protein [Myxococcales bacterium]